MLGCVAWQPIKVFPEQGRGRTRRSGKKPLAIGCPWSLEPLWGSQAQPRLPKPTPAASQAPLSFTISWNLPKFKPTESVMPSNLLVLCLPLLLLPSILPSIRGRWSHPKGGESALGQGACLAWDRDTFLLQTPGAKAFILSLWQEPRAGP